MHVAEETFRSIRMSELEYARVLGEVNLLVNENSVEMEAYPVLHRLFSCLGYTGDQESDVLEEIQIIFDPEEEADQ